MTAPLTNKNKMRFVISHMYTTNTTAVASRALRFHRSSRSMQQTHRVQPTTGADVVTRQGPISVGRSHSRRGFSTSTSLPLLSQRYDGRFSNTLVPAHKHFHIWRPPPAPRLTPQAPSLLHINIYVVTGWSDDCATVTDISMTVTTMGARKRVRTRWGCQARTRPGLGSRFLGER